MLAVSLWDNGGNPRFLRQLLMGVSPHEQLPPVALRVAILLDLELRE